MKQFNITNLLNSNIFLNADSNCIPLPDRSVDMVFTSPPFKDSDVNGDYFLAYDSWMREILRVTKKVAVIINSSTKLQFVLSNWSPDRVLIWSKGINLCSYRWSPIFVYGIPPYKVNRHIWCDAFGVAAIHKKWKVHKYQDPVMLYKTIISMFKDCHSVLDPFMGSGTTGEACSLLGHDFIGLDIDKSCVKLSYARLSEGKAHIS